MHELKALRTEIRQLQTSMDESIRRMESRLEAENERLRFKLKQAEREKDFMVEDLTAENERLREEVRQVYRQSGNALPPVPTPDRDLIEDILKDPAPEQLPQSDAAAPEAQQADLPGSAQVPADSSEAQPVPTEGKVEILSEWGRTPEEAAARGGDTKSLKGIICVVPPGTGDEYLIKLGRTMHKQFDAYDNVNIEVFDDRAAAESFQKTNTDPSGRRVMSVSKHAASGRDVILLIRGEKVEEVPVEDRDNGQGSST